MATVNVTLQKREWAQVVPLDSTCSVSNVQYDDAHCFLEVAAAELVPNVTFRGTVLKPGDTLVVTTTGTELGWVIVRDRDTAIVAVTE